MTQKELEEGLQDLENTVSRLFQKLNIKEKEEEIIKIQSLMSDSNFWKDKEKAEAVVKKIGELTEVVELYNESQKKIQSLQKNLNENDFYETKRVIKKLEINSVFTGKYDSSNALISINSGAGGQDASDFAGMLFDMYTHYAQLKGYKLTVIDESLDDFQSKLGSRPIKSITFELVGSYIYGYLKKEAGVHRLVRISPFSSKGLRHTSFAMVEVLPVLPLVEAENIVIKDDDLNIDTFRSSGPGGQNVNKVETAVRITHIPTGLTVASQKERSQVQNKEKAMNILKGKLIKLMEEMKEEKIENLKTKVKIEWGSQIRSYVLHPYKMVKDHRTGVETSQINDVLAGYIDEFIEAEILG